jgi:hypothetical protein
MALLISCRPELISPNIAVDMMDNAKGVAHMPTATTTKEDSDSKSGTKSPTRLHEEAYIINDWPQFVAGAFICDAGGRPVQ